jgi:hypothetical protein
MLKTSWNRIRSVASKPNAGEAVFQSPPFTEDVVQAVRLISTRLSLKADERSRLLWQQESNDAAAVEYDALRPLLEAIPKPRRVLEIGPGLGRSVVYFSKRGVWADDAQIDLYDTTGSSTKYKQQHYDAPPPWPDVSSFCGNIPLLEQMLRYNGIENYKVWDAATLPMAKLPGDYDLIYGFYSIGFHWSLQHYLGDLAPLLGASGVLLCTLNKHFAPFPMLKQYSVRVLQSAAVKKGSRPLSFLALSKSPLPKVGLSVEDAYAS